MTNADKFIQKFPNLENGGHKCKPFVMDWELEENEGIKLKIKNK